MRRPASVNNKIYDRPLWGMAQGGLPSCGGSRRFLAAWGEPARPGFPLRGNGKGGGKFSFLAAAGWFVDSLCAPFLQFLSQPPTRPASIRTLVWSISLRCLLVSLIMKRVLPSQCRTERLFCRVLVPPRPRSHPNSAICNQTQKFLSHFPFCGCQRLAIPQRLVDLARHP